MRAHTHTHEHPFKNVKFRYQLCPFSFLAKIEVPVRLSGRVQAMLSPKKLLLNSYTRMECLTRIKYSDPFNMKCQIITINNFMRTIYYLTISFIIIIIFF